MGFSVLRIWPIFGSVFRFLHLKTAFFSVLVSYAVGGGGFLLFSLGFRFLSTVMRIFRIFLSNAFYGFSGFAKEVTPCRSRLNCNSKVI